MYEASGALCRWAETGTRFLLPQARLRGRGKACPGSRGGWLCPQSASAALGWMVCVRARGGECVLCVRQDPAEALSGVRLSVFCLSEPPACPGSAARPGLGPPPTPAPRVLPWVLPREAGLALTPTLFHVARLAWPSPATAAVQPDATGASRWGEDAGLSGGHFSSPNRVTGRTG